MMYWTREAAGWTLVVFALMLMRTAVNFVISIQSPRIVEAGVIAFVSVSILRAGILLIRISTAAHICKADREHSQNRSAG